MLLAAEDALSGKLFHTVANPEPGIDVEIADGVARLGPDVLGHEEGGRVGVGGQETAYPCLDGGSRPELREARLRFTSAMGKNDGMHGRLMLAPRETPPP